MTDYPINRSAPEVRALLEGRKTMARLPAWRPERTAATYPEGDGGLAAPTIYKERLPSHWQRVKPGDRLWVREKWYPKNEFAIDAWYWVDRPKYWCADMEWRLPAHMSRMHSRLTLTVTETKIERLQAITNDDAIAEGCGVNFDHPTPDATREAFPVLRFKDLWTSLHGSNAWDANPEVVVLRFTVEQRNIDAEEAA